MEILPKINTAKSQGIRLAQVVNSLILKVKDISIFAAKISIFGGELDKSVLCIYIIVTNHVNWHRENVRLDREKAGKTQGI